MQIVIDIPEKTYRRIQALDSNNYFEHDICGFTMRRIANGTPLPKGHGRILDEKDILDTENNSGGWYDLVDMPEYIAGVKAIIEADKKQEE